MQRERMVGLSGKLVSEINIKSDANAFHDMFRGRKHELPIICPDKLKTCILLQGEWGVVGCVMYWIYILDGKEMAVKDILETVDEEKKLVTFRTEEGDLMEQFKVFKMTVQVDTKGEDNVVTWKIDYEKLNKEVADPHPVMDFCLQLTKDIDAHLQAAAVSA